MTPSDAAAGDNFGSSVAISGSTAVVGAPGKNSNAGAAYVFVKSEGAWSEQAKLTASEAGAGGSFGSSVAISGSTAVVGAPGKSSNAGAAYVFERSGTAWSQRAKLTASDAAAGDQLGRSVAISGSTAVVGAPFKESATGTEAAGTAYVFERSGGSWSQQAKLTDSHAVRGELFGLSVAISDSTAVVGADGKDASAGAAYVFVRSGTAWSQQAKLSASGAAAHDLFGSSVAIDGSTVVAGARGENSDAGAAYVFERSGSSWSQRAKLTASDGAANDRFGSAVAISGATAVVGADGKNSFTGAAYVFVRSGTAWSRQAKLTVSHAMRGESFARSVAIFDSTAVLGAPGESSRAGAAYVFELPSQQAKLTASGAAARDELGYSVAISGDYAVVGAPFSNNSRGAAYVFERSGNKWSERARLTASDAVKFGSSVAISGSTAVVGATGKVSAGAAYLYVRSGTSWRHAGKLTPNDGREGDEFGRSVAMWRDYVVVGAPYESNTGAAYVFERYPPHVLEFKLTASDAAAGDHFGDSVAISGSTAVVGADGKNSRAGAAYVFERAGHKWSQQAKLTASDAAAHDLFGRSVAVSDSTALVGAPGSSGAAGTGAAYVFERSGTTWSQHAKLTASDAAPNDRFGFSVAISGSTAVVGASTKNSSAGVEAGAAYVFERAGAEWPEQAKLTASDAASGDRFGSSVAIDPSTAVVGAPGKDAEQGAAYVFGNI